MEFKPVPVSEPINAAQVSALQDSVADLARRIPDQLDLSIVPVKSGEYKVKGSDRYLIVDARGGVVKIVLPLPKQKQELTILKAYETANTVTVVSNDGKKIGNDSAVITIADIANLLADSLNWWLL